VAEEQRRSGSQPSRRPRDVIAVRPMSLSAGVAARDLNDSEEGEENDADEPRRRRTCSITSQESRAERLVSRVQRTKSYRKPGRNGLAYANPTCFEKMPQIE